ncbi:mitochondrial ribosomal protein L52 [Arctopsyche grandis]|uniref:mitochondrial ribosomal protein L52 n=1 Tax=Arctopsyche grandis TaxID=121162 RepID=UPI00406DA041
MDILKCFKHFRVLAHRQIHTSSLNLSREWRRKNGLPINKTLYGPLTDLPDYTFLDGRVTPIGSRQRSRILNEQKVTEKIIKLTKQVDFAKDHYQYKLEQEEANKKALIERRLKSKGQSFFK